MTQNAQVIASDNAQYGSASNGRHVDSGYDVEIKRESTSFAIVNVMSPNGDIDELDVIDVDADTNLQMLAVEIGNCPSAALPDRIDSDDEGWNALADRWNRIKVQW